MIHKARHQAIKVAWDAYVGASMDPANLDETYATADEAKAAAQADHIARIRSALITETDNG